MKGEAQLLVKLLQGSQTRFVVPVYQRNYDWKREQCSRLFDDLEDVINEDRPSHFFGSLVSQFDLDTRILIDGQQRVTTIFLLLSALLTQIKDKNIKCENNRLAELINNEYLRDQYDESEQKLKLKLVKDDNQALLNVMSGDATKFIAGSNVTANYEYFLERIAETELTAEQLHNAIRKLQVIDIKLEQGDDAQLIFESLNSTGLDLNDGDKIRNYILMNLDTKTQEDYYTRYWNEIEKNTNFDVSNFIRDYLTASTGSTPAFRRVYAVFREFSNGKETQALLEDLLRNSEYYKWIVSGDCGEDIINGPLRRLSLLEMGVINPFLLRLFDYYKAGNVTVSVVHDALRTIESYLFRRWVCNVPTNALNKVFETLHSDVLKGVNDGADYLDVLVYSLLKREGSGRFPTDTEFREGFKTRNFYQIGSKRFYLYDSLENSDNVERVNVVEMLKDDTLSVEHIMPQTLTPKWRDALGENADEIYERWINSMGNLTLTGYNSQYSNRDFAEKRDCKHGFKDSGLKLNHYVASCETWGEEQIKERSKQLWKQFLQFWPKAATNYLPKAETHESHSLDEEINFTGRKIVSYTFQGARCACDTWADMIVDVISCLYRLNPSVIENVAKSGKWPARYFTDTEPGYGSLVGTKLWFIPSCSTSTKIDILQHLIDKIDDVEQSDLTFELAAGKTVLEDGHWKTEE